MSSPSSMSSPGSTSIYDDVGRAAAVVTRAIAPRAPRVGVILGSGLGRFAETLDDAVALPYASIPGFPVSSVPGHAGQLVAGSCQGVQALVMQGRVHCYEGYPIEQVVLPARALVACGCRRLIITNAAGGIRAELRPGDLALITDHINLSGRNPLVGPGDERLGPRFPDMSDAYDPALRKLAHAVAAEEGVTLREGVYSWLVGPSYETPAEIRMLRTAGADLAGMSTVPEVIAVHQMGARVLGISCVTNLAAGLGGKLSHDEVKETAARVEKTFLHLLARIIARLHEE